MQSPAWSGVRKIRDLVKNQTNLSGTDASLSIYDTYAAATGIALDSEQILFCSMIAGRKIIYEAQTTHGHAVQSGEAFLLAPGSHVEIDCPDATLASPTTCLAVEISPEKVKELSEYMSDDCPIGLAPNAYSIDAAPGIVRFTHTPATRQLMGRMVSIFTEDHPDKTLLIDLSIKELIVRLLRYRGREFLLDYSKHTPDGTGITAALNHIRQNLAGPLCIEKLARIACMSRSRLYAQFKRDLGCSPGECHQQLRLKEAARRLAMGATITAVSYELGFSQPSHFSHRFRDLFGCSPREYRNRTSGTGPSTFD